MLRIIGAAGAASCRGEDGFSGFCGGGGAVLVRARSGALGDGGGLDARGGEGDAATSPASEGRLPAAASRTIVARSGMLRIGRHSSRPSCQQSDSSVTAPVAALRRSSEMRTGPTGTPLIATYHSSLTESSIETEASRPPMLEAGASSTLLANAPASDDAGASDAFGFWADRLVARPGRAGGSLMLGRAPGAGGGTLPLPSVTAERTSIWCPHLRHFMRTVLPATLSSAIWYFALQLSQRNFTREPDLNRSWFFALRSRKRAGLREASRGEL